MLVAETLSSLPDLTVEQAEQWIAAALAAAKALRQHDAQFYPDASDAAALAAARQLHAAWQRWAEDAEALLSVVRPLVQAKRHVAGVYDLEHVLGSARASLAVSPESMQ